MSPVHTPRDERWVRLPVPVCSKLLSLVYSRHSGYTTFFPPGSLRVVITDLFWFFWSDVPLLSPSSSAVVVSSSSTKTKNGRWLFLSRYLEGKFSGVEARKKTNFPPKSEYILPTLLRPQVLQLDRTTSLLNPNNRLHGFPYRGGGAVSVWSLFYRYVKWGPTESGDSWRTSLYVRLN